MNSESPNTETPTVAQLHEARLARWHQTGEALMTGENLRSWINAAGLVLFAPRPQVVAPAPTLVEAVLGAPNAEPTLQSVTDARNLVARLVADGVALPLNLMGTHGTPGDSPDFVVSAAVFPYVFTLRGDKAWKQPPATSGAIKVSNLGLATYEVLSSKGPMSAYDLATQLGKEVTEAACLRALNELWTQLRVIPLIQPDGSATTWELLSARFTKQIKAGANAGQPTALSTLISLYLGQVMVATEDEIESFLSPLAARSRIREVAHALLSARQLETLVLEGKTLLHVAGEAPSFAAAATEKHSVEVVEAEPNSGEQPAEDGSRITKYIPKPRKIGTGYLAKGKPAAAKRPFDRGDSRGRSETFKPRTGSRDERERRPFRKPTEGAAERRFDRPWEEDRPRRAAQKGGDSPPARKPRPTEQDQGSQRREFRSGPRPPRRDEDRPARRPRAEGFAGRERRDDHVHGRSDRSGSPRPFQKRPEGRAREAGFSQDRPAFRRFDAPKGDRPSDRPRPTGDRADRRPRTGDSDRRPRRDGDFKPRTARPAGGFEARPPRREGGLETRPPRREGTGRPPRREGGFEGRPRREAASETRPPRREGGFEARPAKKPFGKPKFGGGAGKTKFGGTGGKSKFGGGTGKFAKSPGKKKPFSKKPTDRTFRPRRDESA